MKRLFVVLAICATVLAGCDDGNGNDNGSDGVITTLKIRNQSSKTISDVTWNNVSFFGKKNADIIGIWVPGPNSSGTTYQYLTLVISDNTWDMSGGNVIVDEGSSEVNAVKDEGTWTRNGNNFTFKSRAGMYGVNSTATLSGGILTLNIQSKQIGPVEISGSSYELISNNLDLSFNSGTNITKPVEEGTEYIYLKIGSFSCRTNELIAVTKNESTEFNFTNDTLIVDVNDTNNTLTLGDL